MKYLYIIYLLLGLFAVIFGITGIINNDTNIGAYIGIAAIGAYFLGRGVYLGFGRKYKR